MGGWEGGREGQVRVRGGEGRGIGICIIYIEYIIIIMR